MRKKLIAGIAMLAVVALTTGCAKPPQNEIDAAKAALTAADGSQAAKYATAEWEAATQAMNAVDAEVEAQAQKFALFRSYKKAQELTAAATQAAAAAQEAAVAGKQAAMNAAQAAVDAAKAAVTAAEELYVELGKCRRQPKDFKKDMEMMRGNLDGLVAQVGGLDSAFASEDYFGAKAQAESLKGQLDMLTADMQGAKEKIKC
jgi:hypothetical protein